MTQNLTVDKLKQCLWRTVAHMSGEGFTSLRRANSKYGLVMMENTSGHPKYQLTEKVLATKDFDIHVDLVSDRKAALEEFCQKYNARAKGEK